MDWITNPEIWIGLLTLTVLEIVLGIDNIIFISILAGKLPHEQQPKARQWGLALALVTRLMLLCSLAWMAKLTKPLVEVFGHSVTGRDLVLIIGGLFLLFKSTREIHEKLEGEDGGKTNHLAPKFWSVVVEIAIMDIVFSLDSVITAIGMTSQLAVMIAAVIIALLFMLYYSGQISAFINRHPSLKMLALSFLMMIGCLLVAEGFHKEIPRGYIYFSMAFATVVECLNIQARKKASAVKLNQPYR